MTETQTISLSGFNKMPEADAASYISRCCGAKRWVEEMVALRPFESIMDLMSQAECVWQQLERPDWLEAFAQHAKIGDINSLKAKYGQTKDWAKGEQANVDLNATDVLEELAKLNQEYENRFGYMFIVCATGKTALEMLNILKSRINNDPDKEILLASREQNKITLLRLEKLLT
jgi:2-oxo-4-hydroxy-4-carboxy-5-ureidoimidazoline decarboxylase